MRGVQDDTHEDTSESAGDGNRENPADNEETYTLPVDSLVVELAESRSVAQTDADGRACGWQRGTVSRGHEREEQGLNIPVMHIEVETGSENWEKMRTVMAADSSMEQPRLGEW